MRRDERRHLPVLETPDPDPLLPSRVHPFGRLGIGGVNDVVAVDRQTARTAELIVLADELAVLGQDLDAMVVTVGDDQLSLSSRIRARAASGTRPGRCRSCQSLRRNLPFLSNTEMRPTRFGSATSVWLSAT